MTHSLFPRKEIDKVEEGAHGGRPRDADEHLRTARQPLPPFDYAGKTATKSHFEPIQKARPGFRSLCEQRYAEQDDDVARNNGDRIRQHADNHRYSAERDECGVLGASMG